MRRATRQHNEPAGGQDVWHLHVHVFPRYPGDELYSRHADAYWAPAEQRAAYAESLCAQLDGVNSRDAGR